MKGVVMMLAGIHGMYRSPVVCESMCIYCGLRSLQQTANVYRSSKCQASTKGFEYSLLEGSRPDRPACTILCAKVIHQTYN